MWLKCLLALACLLAIPVNSERKKILKVAFIHIFQHFFIQLDVGRFS